MCRSCEHDDCDPTRAEGVEHIRGAGHNSTPCAKSDPGDAKVLADIVRTDRQDHRPGTGTIAIASIESGRVHHPGRGELGLWTRLDTVWTPDDE